MARFAFDGDLCVKCHACEVACAQWHGKDAGERGYREVTEEVVGEFPQVRRVFQSKAQRGCDLCRETGGVPRCALTCPTSALRYE